MSCDPRLTVDCEFACNCNPQTATTYTMVNANIAKGDSVLVVQGEAPCCGFGIWKPCPTGQAEIFRIQNGVYNAINDTTTLTIVRGLAFSGCDYAGDSDLAFAHTATQELIIGDVGIHYYYCALCARIACLEEVECCAADYAAIQAIADPEVGQRCVAWNSGSPMMYVYDCLGVGAGWKALWDCARTRACLSVSDPITYDSSTGIFGLNYYNCHFGLGSGNRLELLVPQAEVGHSGYRYGSNQTFNSGNSLTVIAETDITIPAIGPGECNNPTLINLMWQIDNNPHPTGAGDGTSQGYSLNIMRSVNGGAFVAYATDYQDRQRTNWGYNDSNSTWNDNDMQTIPFFDIVTDRSVSYSYRLQYEYKFFDADIQIAQISKDYSYITLAQS